MKRVAGFKAVGFTPIGVSLREAAKDLGTRGKRRVVLVSDGDDTCAPPPPGEVARELKAQGIDLAVDVVRNAPLVAQRMAERYRHSCRTIPMRPSRSHRAL
ncbi:hypothetical protein [Streptomyces sp. NPDC015130]|uniref:hypothetical protein n=1 Tax=Streptomyces sp. NPDC015130 TaxID=3364940 RepID=UPI0036FA1B12